MESVLQQQLFPEIERRPADKEVLRYSSAMQFGFEKIAKLPLSNRLILGIHKQLLGENSTGYRTTQNRIVNSVTDEVLYTPPVAADVPRLIANWENYVNNDKDQTDPLIKCAIAHYQFEAIHPFGDGNGRTGRIMMVLHLVSEGLLDYPVLYISGYINKTRAEYYKLLRGVSVQKDWCAFIDYMLKGFYLQAADTKQQMMRVMELWRTTKENVRSELPKVYSAELVDALFSNPVVTPVRLGGILNVHYTTATRYLKQIEEKKFVRHQAMGKYQLYINDRLLKALRGDA